MPDRWTAIYFLMELYAHNYRKGFWEKCIRTLTYLG